jgi:hypothetical protein
VTAYRRVGVSACEWTELDLVDAVDLVDGVARGGGPFRLASPFAKASEDKSEAALFLAWFRRRD